MADKRNEAADKHCGWHVSVYFASKQVWKSAMAF